MNDDLCVEYAETRLGGHAKIFWEDERHAAYRRGQPITSWTDMAQRLKKKYVPREYESTSFPRQGTMPVREHMEHMVRPTDDIHFSPSQHLTRVAPTRSSPTTSASPMRSRIGNGRTTLEMLVVSAPSQQSPPADAPHHTTTLSQVHTTCFKCLGEGHWTSQCPLWNLLREVKGLDRGSHEDDLPSGDDVYLADEALTDECDDTPELIDHTPIRPATLTTVEAPALASTLTSTPMRDMVSVAIPRSLVDVILPPQLPVVTSREVLLVPRPSTLTSMPPMDNLLCTSIFYPREKINSYVCQVIVDISGCDHAALESVLHLLGLNTVSHHLPDDASSVGAPSPIHLHGLSTSIISNRDMRFTSHFRRTFESLLGTKLTFSSGYHPQIDGRIDVIDHCMRKQLRSLAHESLTIWDVTLPSVECTYHPSSDHTSGVSPVEIAHGLAPRKPLDIVPLDPHVRVSRDRVACARHVSQLHQDIHDRVVSQYASYKQAADLHCRPRVFQVGDQVMVRLRPERYAPGTARSIGPSQVLSRIGGIAYVVDIPPSWGISSTFHVMDLTSHPALPLSSDVKPSPTGPLFEREFSLKSTTPVLPPDQHRRVEEIFREVIDNSEDGVSWRFLVHWPGRPPEDDVYISEVDLERLRSDLWSPCLRLLLTRRSRVLPTPGGLVAYDPRRHQDTIPRRRRSPFARADLSAYLYFFIMKF